MLVLIGFAVIIIIIIIIVIVKTPLLSKSRDVDHKQSKTEKQISAKSMEN